MEPIDVKKLETAIVYLQRIADGNNPVNNMPAEEDAVLNNPNVIRCMFFVKEVMEEVRRNGGYIGKKQGKNGKLDFPVDVLKSFVYKEVQPITKFVNQINELIDANIYKKLSYKTITSWLKANGFLVEEYIEEIKDETTIPTDKGLKMGISSEKRIGTYGKNYIVVLYGEKAQEYIINNMEVIINGEVAVEDE